MRRFGVVALLAVALAAAACAPATLGPSRPIAQEQVGGTDGVDVAAARLTALRFLTAYANSGMGIGPLQALVAGPQLRSWVRWLGVQNREFDGTIEGSVDLRSASFTASRSFPRTSPGPIRTFVAAQVDLRASVTLTYAPANGETPFDLRRILDGPMTLLQTGTAGWRVVDVTRDGASMDAGITRFQDQTRRLAGVTVTLDSVFRFVPNWQFNVVVTNGTDGPIGLDPANAVLVIRQPDGIQTLSIAPTRSLASVAPGATVEALISVRFQESSKGRVLSLPFVGSDGRERTFAFPLGGIIPSPGQATGEGSPAPTPS